MQLDIFENSRDVMLRNDVLQALALHDGAQARAVWETLHQEYPEDLSLPPLLQLIESVGPSRCSGLVAAFLARPGAKLSTLGISRRL